MTGYSQLLLASVCLLPNLSRAAELQAVTCDGTYTHHLQGVCTDETASIYWSFTTTLVKTDLNGQVLQRVDVANHHGDLCLHDGLIFVAVNLGKFNEPKGQEDSWVYVYDAKDLTFLRRHKTPEVVYGAGGIAHHAGRFWIVGGLPKDVSNNVVYEYDTDFRFVNTHTLKSGYTTKGIQTAAFAADHWWFGCYGNPAILLKADASFRKVQRFTFNCNLGIVPIGEGNFLVARGGVTKDKQHTGRLVLAESDDQTGLKVTEQLTEE